jgi:hypothetical protein
MGEREVRSPWNTTGNEPMRGYSPGSRSSPSRAVGGHIAHNLGKGGHRPVSAKRDAVPVVGSGSSAALERQLDGSMRGDSRRR